jgi:hypothetical protein
MKRGEFIMTAAIPVPLTPEEKATLLAYAKAQGVSVDTLLRKAVLQIIFPTEPGEPSLNNQLSGEELERAFEEIAELIPDNVPPIPDEALRRENMYSREDEW